MFYYGRGCASCDGTGFRGRSVVYELLPVGTGIRQLIHDKMDAYAIKAAAIDEGMQTVSDSAVALARAGTISLAEAYSVYLE